MKVLKLMKTDLGYEGYEAEDMMILREITGIPCPVLVNRDAVKLWGREAQKQGYAIEIHY